MVSANPHYSVVFARSARKELEKLDSSIAIRVLEKIEKLANAPRPHGCKKLRGRNRLWRIRVGDYRVVYDIDDEQQIVDITIIRHRNQVYKDID